MERIVKGDQVQCHDLGLPHCHSRKAGGVFTSSATKDVSSYRYGDLIDGQRLGSQLLLYGNVVRLAATIHVRLLLCTYAAQLTQATLRAVSVSSCDSKRWP
jgi:hypothetical protein